MMMMMMMMMISWMTSALHAHRSAARLTPQRTSATALFDYISAGRFTHRACHHWRPNLPGGCCICLEQSAGVSTGIAVTASFSQQTEDRAFCPVVQLLWLRASHCTDYHVTSLLFLRVTCPCSLRTYATLKFIRSYITIIIIIIINCRHNVTILQLSPGGQSCRQVKWTTPLSTAWHCGTCQQACAVY